MEQIAKLDKKTLSGVTEMKDNLSGLRSDNEMHMYKTIIADHALIRYSLKERREIQQTGMWIKITYVY